MASSQSSSFTKTVLFFLLFLNPLTFAIRLSDRSAATRTDLPCISKCLSGSSVTDTSVCKDSTIDVDNCLCAMIKSIAQEATFADCVESCSQEERNKLRGICGAGQVGGNDSEKKEVLGGIKENSPILSSLDSKNGTTSGGKDDDGDDDNGGDSVDDGDDDDDKPQKAPDVNVTDTNSRNSTRNKKNPDTTGSASLLVGQAGWMGIGAAVAAVMLVGLV